MGKTVVVLGTQWGDEGKGKNRRPADRAGRSGSALSGWPQCWPHAGD